MEALIVPYSPYKKPSAFVTLMVGLAFVSFVLGVLTYLAFLVAR